MAVEYILYNDRQLGGVVAFLVRRAGAGQVVAARVARRRNREHDCVEGTRYVLSEALPADGNRRQEEQRQWLSPWVLTVVLVLGAPNG